MRKWITLLMTLLVAGSASYANANTGQVNLEAGYRRDTIEWRNRFPSDDPIFSSSHRFKDLDIFQIGLNGRTTIGCNFYLRANAYWGWILDGDFRHSAKTTVSDYYNSDLDVGFSNETRSVIDERYVYGVGAAIGYPFYFCDCTTMIAPVIGYAFDEQVIRVDDGDFADLRFADSYESRSYSEVSGNKGCCRQTFNSRWYGPYVGVDFNYRPYNDCWNVYAEVEFHWGCFRGRRSHQSYEDFSGNLSSHDARAWVIGGGAEYELCNHWTVGLSFKVQDWQGNRHHRIDRSEDKDESGYRERSRNNNKWRSYAINLTFGRDF